MKIGILLGCFNPIHNAHLRYLELLKQKILDKIIFVPAYTNLNYKDKTIISWESRVEMLTLALEGIKDVEISTIEIDQHRQLYTYETLELFRKDNRNQYYLVIGSDNLASFDTWKNYETILTNHNIVVVTRDNANNEELINQNPNLKKYQHKFISFTCTNISDISSTTIRNLIEKSEDITKYVPKKVNEYIKTNNLYRNEE